MWLQKEQMQRVGASQRLERCKSVAVTRNYQLQHPGALQERRSAQEAAVAASRSVAGAWQ